MVIIRRLSRNAYRVDRHVAYVDLQDITNLVHVQSAIFLPLFQNTVKGLHNILIFGGQRIVPH